MTTEDGSGVPNADSYAALAATATFHAARGNEDWDEATSPQQSVALIRATDFLEATYRANGDPLTLSQALQWPRLGDTGLDSRVVRATMLLALEALKGPLNERVERGVKSLEETGEGVGSIKTVYDDVAPTDPYPHITAILSDIATLRSSSAAVWVGRLVK